MILDSVYSMNLINMNLL